MTLRERVAQRMLGTPLFKPARAAFHAIFGGQLARERKARMRAFYSQFFRPGAIVFDIGANVGEYTEVFASLGAGVIAVEPNPACLPKLRRLVQRQPMVQLCECAIGDAIGRAKLMACSETLYSSLNTDWVVNKAPKVEGYEDVEWTPVEVPVVTLDSLAAKYGQPTFVKIDVEGYEREVLRGMSFAPRYVSFEWNAPMAEVARDCIRILGSRGYVFNCIRARKLTYVHEQWLTPGETEHWLSTFEGTPEYGDVFARRT